MINEFFYNFFNSIFLTVGDNYQLSIIIFIIISSILLMLPIPSSIILIFSGIFFDSHSFFINFLILNISSLLIYIFAGIVFSIENRYTNTLQSKINLLSKKINNITYYRHLIIYRALLPFSVFNYAAGIFRLGMKKFILINIIGLIPRVLMISSLGTGLKQSLSNDNNLFYSFIDNNYTKIFLITLITLHLIKRLKKD